MRQASLKAALVYFLYGLHYTIVFKKYILTTFVQTIDTFKKTCSFTVYLQVIRK